jgi:membrane protein YdbS with pleckstrin-like domain
MSARRRAIKALFIGLAIAVPGTWHWWTWARLINAATILVLLIVSLVLTCGLFRATERRWPVREGRRRGRRAA